MRKAWSEGDKILLKFGGDGFQADLELVKSMPGRRFDPKTKIWNVPDNDKNRETLNMAGFAMSEELAINFVDLVDESWKDLKVDFPKLEDPYDFYPYQKDSIRYLLHHKNRAVLGLGMGLGKTLISLSFIEMTEDALPALIICPSPVKANFKNDYKKFFGRNDIEILEGDDSITKYKKKAIYVVNYELLSRSIEKNDIHYKARGGKQATRTKKVVSKNLARFIATGFKTVIADEVHRLKNEDSNAFFAFQNIIEHADNIFGMSGTPILSRPSEIWSYYHNIKPETFPNKQSFLQRYCEPRTIHVGGGRRVTLYDGATNMLELNRKLRNNGLLVMDKEEVAKDLPDRPIRTVIPIEMDHYDEYEQAREVVLDEIYENPKLILTKFEKLKQLSVKYKFKHMIEYIDNILDIQDKVVVFADHQKIVEKLHKHYKGSVIFNGTMSPKQKEKSKTEFIENPKCPMIIGNIQSMGTGVDGLQKSGASDIVFVEFPWNPSDIDQSEGRLWRDGFASERGISVHFLVGSGTIEEEIIEKLDAKKTVVEAVINGTDADHGTLLTHLRDKYMEEARQRRMNGTTVQAHKD